MRSVAYSVSFLLILTLPLSMGNTVSQVTTTITTQATTTELYAYPVTTRYVTTTKTRYADIPGVAFGPQDFKLNVCGYGARWSATLAATQGERYHVEWTNQGAISLDFYITPNFAGANNVGCDTFPTTEAIFAHSGATGSVDWAAPSTGQFIMWLWNPSTLQVTGTISVLTQVPLTFAVVSSASANTTRTFMLTQILTSHNNATLNTVTPTLIGGAPAYILIIIVGIALVALAISVPSRSRREKPKKETTRVYDVTVTEVGAFCINCGASLLPGATYCRKCGTEQPLRTAE